MSKNTLTSATDRFWYGRGRHIIEDAADAHTLSNEAFRAGARWSLAETTRLSPHIGQFIEMLILLGVYDGLVEAAQNASDSTPASSATTGDCAQFDDDELRGVQQAI